MVQPPPATHKHDRGPLIATLVVLAIAVALVLWSEAPTIFPPKPGPSVTLTGIDRTLSYSGGTTGYVDGMIASGCPVCPLVIAAGTSVTVNVSWIGAGSPWLAGLHYVFVNWTIRSPYPFVALSHPPGTNPSVYSWSQRVEFGNPGGWEGVPLTFSIPADSSGLAGFGTVQIWYNATAF